MARLAIVVSQLEPLHTPPSHSTTAALISTEDESDVSICIGNISQVCVCVDERKTFITAYLNDFFLQTDLRERQTEQRQARHIA